AAAVKGPLRLPKLCFAFENGFNSGAGLAIKIPPAAAVRDEVQLASGRPLRLEDGLVAAARNFMRIPWCTGPVQVCQPQLGAIPGYVGVVPRQPAQPPAV